MQTAFNNLLNGSYPDNPDAPVQGFQGPATIVRFTKNHQQPYGIQHSLTVEFEPAKDHTLNLTYLRTHGVHLGSFYNINQAPNGFNATFTTPVDKQAASSNSLRPVRTSYSSKPILVGTLSSTVFSLP